MKLKIKTLTPVHVSTGKDLEPFDYIEEKGFVYRISLEKALDVISGETPSAIEDFTKWLDKKLFGLENQKGKQNSPPNKGQSKVRREINFREFCERHLGNPALVDRLLESAVVYKMPLPFGMQNNSQINEQIKTPDNLPYIPGSSIKGAVRTALAANAWLKLIPDERRKITRDTKASMQRYNPSKYYDGKDEELMKLLFSCNSNGEERFDAARFSILKFFHFSDAHPVPTEMKETMETNPVFLYLKDKEPQPQTNTQEMIAPGVIFEFDLKVDTAGLIKAFKESKKERGMWRDLEKKLERLLDVKLGDIQDDLEKKLVDALFVVLNSHAKNTYEKDSKWFEGLLYFTQQNGIQNTTIKRIRKLYDSGLPPEGGTLRTGWGSGFLSTTIFHSLKQTDEPFLKEMFEDMGIGIPRGGSQKKSPPNLEYFPKSRRMTAQSLSIPDSVIGWIQIAEDFKEEEMEKTEVTKDSGEQVPVAPDQTEIIAKYKAENMKLKKKDTQKMYARVLRSEPPIIVCEILNDEISGEYKVRYPSGLPADSFVQLNVTFTKKNEVQTVTFAKALV